MPTRIMTDAATASPSLACPDSTDQGYRDQPAGGAHTLLTISKLPGVRLAGLADVDEIAGYHCDPLASDCHHVTELEQRMRKYERTHRCAKQPLRQ